MKTLLRQGLWLAAASAAVFILACSGGASAGTPPEPAPPSPSFQLTLTRTGDGTVTSSPAGVACGTTCSATFASGTAVTLTAEPAAGYSFRGWSGGGCTGTAACNTTVAATTSIQADFVPVAVAGTQYIPLSLAEGPAAASVPVRTGIPLPKGALSNISALRLETGDGGQEVPAWFDALARWPDGSIKVALLQLVTDLGAARSYRVAYGAGVVRASLPRNIIIGGSPSTELTVDTGLAKFTVSNKGVITRLWRDTSGNGAFEAAEQLVDAGELFMVNAYDNLEYTASAATDAVVTVEESGPLRAVIKAQGSLTNASGAKLLKYLVRYYAHQGSDKVDLEVSVIDDRAEANVESTPTSFAIAARALGMRWHYLSEGAADYRFGGEGGAEYGAKVSGEHSLLQKGQFRFEDGNDLGHTFSYSGVGTGSRAPGWVALDSGNRHLAVMVRDFWQQFPGELSINGNTLTASLFPARGGSAETTQPVLSGVTYRRAESLYFARPGGAKTWQLRLALSHSKGTTSALHSLNDSYQRHRLELTATPEWYVSSGVFGDLDVGTPTGATRGYDASLMQDIYVRSIEQTDGNATMFGWRDYGDRLRAGWAYDLNGVHVPSFYNDTHVGANNFYKQFLRSGDPRWFQLADISTRHFMDFDVSHGPRAGYWSTGGKPQPAGEVHAINHENVDHQVRNLHWGHAHVSGLSDNYLLTGDKRSLDVLTEIANWWKFVSPYFFKRPFKATDLYREAERDFSWPLYVMNEYVRATGDAAYHRDVAGSLVSYLMEWFRTPLNHVGYDPATGAISNTVLGVNDASQGKGYWTMTKMDNNGGYNATGTNPWMAGALIANLIKFREADLQFAAAGQASGVSPPALIDMLLQGTNYVVKYGYDSSKKYFVYSEVTRGYSGGDNHIIYALAYLDRLHAQELAAGRLPHPEWYDTRSTWGTIATRRYDELRNMTVGANTQSYGFYGYEIVYPADFFKVMKDTLGR
ncbi:hypothetical protein JY651_27555 [Pyxidicoccus parkwayensis]|uniref:Bacterial repeat domain-containing protein n=1 Tax=Pyxidicoccus parkwayensis TaxID=2813578 RepID=A0ABX7NSG5_9BACT|nr:hypothetical protein [Pyxidicoccus parkwaysis]QSQ19103.1 hypothetical protein JY651_27555 [Pyxidicoccus parkwaysis]